MPYNNPIKKKDSACKQLKSETSKPSGLMMEGSVAYQESVEQEKKDLMKDTPVDSKGTALEMSPYKMDHEGSPNKMSPLNDNHGKIDPRTGKKTTYRLKGTSNMYDDEGFLKPEYSGASQANKDSEYGIVLSDLNKMGKTFSTGDEERDFEYRDGGYQLKGPAGTRESNLYPGAKGTGTVTNSTTRQYTPEEMKNIVNTTREYNRPIINATRRYNAGDYTQEQIDIYNRMQESGATDYVNKWYRSPGRRATSPKYTSGKG